MKALPSTILAAAILVHSLAPSPSPAEAPPPPRPAFTMRFDDNRPASWWRDVGDIFERHGFRCSFAVNAAELSESQGACLKELAARGHEIMDHTPSHSIYLAKYPDAGSFERARRLPFAHDADPETRKVFFSWDVRDDHPSNTTFRARVEAGRLVPADGETAPKGHCFLKLPGHEGVFGLKAENGTLELRDFWGRRPPEPLDLPECDILRYASAAMRPCDGLLRELASLSRERFDHFGIPRPTSWVFPGGWCSHIPQDGMERVYGRGFGYRTADAQLGDAKLGESPWYVPYNAMLFFDQGPDITAEGLVDGIEKRLAAGKWHITLSHIMTRDIKDFLAKTERFAQLLEERRIPVATLADSVAARFPETAAKPALEVALTFDGSAKEHATVVAPMLAEYGWHGTFYLVAGDVGVREDTLTWDDARDLVRAGHILANHARTPFARPLDEGKEDDQRREILDSAAKIEAETGFRANAVWKTRLNAVGGETFDVAKFRAMLERNVAEGRPLCVLAFPGIGKTGSRPFPNGAADLRAAFDVLRDMERSGVIRVVSGKTENGNGSPLDGTWRLNGSNLVCRIRNASRTPLFVPVWARTGVWICHFRVEYSLDPEDFPDIPDAKTLLGGPERPICSDSSPIDGISPHDSDVLFRLLPPDDGIDSPVLLDGDVDYVERAFPLDRCALASARRALQPSSDIVFDVTLGTWLLGWKPPESDGRQDVLWTVERVRLRPWPYRPPQNGNSHENLLKSRTTNL